jgi:hypothetical protein
MVHRVNRPPVLLIALIVLSICPSVTHAQDLSQSEEAPESIFQFDIGDAEVDLFLSGEWQARSEFGYTWRIPLSSATPAQLSIPGLAGPLPLANRVDLTISLWLLERYFLEASISDEFDTSTLLLGYVGAPGELVQSVRIGTTGIGMRSYPYLDFGGGESSGGQDGPGASVFLQTSSSEHEAMIRFSPGSLQTLTWSNGRVRSAVETETTEYIRQTFYVLPDGGLTTLRLYQESPTGPLTGTDGRRYRELSIDEIAGFSLVDGTVRFLSKLDRRTLIYYEVAGVPVGSPALGRNAFFGLNEERVPDASLTRDFSFDPAEIDEFLAYLSADPTTDGPDPDPELSVSDVRVTVGGVDALVLHQPGRLSPFEQLSYYKTAADSGAYRVVTASGVSVGSSLQFVADAFSPVVAVRANNADPRAFENRYPFASNLIEIPQPQIYPAAQHSAAPHRIVSEQISQASEITLAAGTIPATVRVLRNGVPERQFTLTDSGLLVFDRPLSAQDVVEVRFRVSEGDSTDALIGIGNRFYPVEGISVDLALGARWNASAGAYSNQPAENSGSLVLSAGAAADERSGIGEWITGRASSALSFSSADTTGVLRVESMDGAELTLPVSPYSQFPAAPPVVDPDTGDGLAVSSAERGILIHRDLFVPDAFGNRNLSSHEFRAEFPASTVNDGERAGPYPARVSQAEYSGTAMVLEYEIPPLASWVGGQLQLADSLDLGSAAELRLPYLLDEGAGTTEVYLQLGVLPEDLDGDGTLDSGSGALPFNDSRTGVTFLAGTPQPPQLFYSEDQNGNGLLDPGLPERTVTKGPLPLVPGEWRTLTIPLTRAERARLTRTHGVALFVVRDIADGLPRSGSVLVGNLTAGTEPVSLDTPGAPVTAQARALSRTNNRLAMGLSGAFSELDATLLRDEVNGSHLFIDWTGLTSGTVLLTRATNVPLSDYGELRVYLRNEAPATSPVVSIRARGLSGIIAEESVTLDTTDWREHRVVLPDRWDERVTSVELELSAEQSGTVIADEISFWNPRSSVALSATLDLTVTPPVDVALAGVPLLSNLVVGQEFSVQSGRLASDGQAGAGFASRTSLTADLISGRFLSAADISSTEGATGLAFSHSAERPIGDLILLQDEFRSSTGVPGERWRHAASLVINPASTPQFEAHWSQENGSEQTREWELSFRDRGAFAESDLAATFSETSNSLQRDSYASRWISGFTGILGTETVDSRSLALRARLTSPPQPVGIESGLSLSGVSSTGITPARYQFDTLLAIPWALGNGQEIRLQLDRVTSLSTTDVPAVGVSAEYARSFSTLATYPVAFSTVPVYEVFDPEFQERFAQSSAGALSARFVPALSVSFRAPATPSVFSLLRPVSASLAIERTAERDADAVRSYYGSEAELSFVSVNLFGRMGVVPLFRLYDSDEFQTRIALSSLQSPGNEWQHKLLVNQQTRFFLPADTRLQLVTELGLLSPAGAAATELSLQSALELTWISHSRNMQLEHSELLELALDQGMGQFSSVRVRHESRILFNESGSASGFLGLAVARATTSADVLLMGIEAGISGKLRY